MPVVLEMEEEENRPLLVPLSVAVAVPRSIRRNTRQTGTGTETGTGGMVVAAAEAADLLDPLRAVLAITVNGERTGLV